MGVSLQDADRLPMNVASAMIETARRQHPLMDSFLLETMDADEKPLVADVEPKDFFSDLKKGLYGEEAEAHGV